MSRTSPRVQWLLVYLSHPTSLLFFSFGIFSLVAIQIQIAALAAAESHALSQATSGIGQVTSLVGARLNDTMAPASLAFANSSNLILADFSNLVNNDLFGFADSTTTNLNNTLNAFYDDLVSVVNTIFGSTPLADPAQELIRCLIGSKVAGVQTALTFIHDNAHVSLLTVSPTLLMLSDDRLNDLAASVSGTGNASSPGFAHSLVNKLVDHHRKSLEAQRIGALVMLSLWTFIALLGIAGVLWDRRGSHQPSFALRRPAPRKPSVRVSSPLDFFDRRLSSDSLPHSHEKPPMVEIASPKNVRFAR